MKRNFKLLALFFGLGLCGYFVVSFAKSEGEVAPVASNVEVSNPSLEMSLKQIVSEFEPILPKLYKDGTTTLVAVKAGGRTFTYNYELDTDWMGPITKGNIETTRRSSCNRASGVRPFIDLGARIEHSYVNRDGHFLGSFFVELSDCANFDQVSHTNHAGASLGQ